MKKPRLKLIREKLQKLEHEIRAIHRQVQKLTPKVVECMVVIKLLIDKNIITPDEVAEELKKLYGTIEDQEIQQGP